MITSAPSARSNRAFSCDILSGIVKMHRYPFTAAARASPTPVLPDVASTIRPPGLRRPSRSAASIIATPIRSFTEPPGLKNSALANTGVRTPCVTLFRRMSGVHPIVSRTFPYGLVWVGIGASLQHATLGKAELDRLKKHRGHGDPAPPRGGESQPLRAGERRRIEGRVATRLRDPRGVRGEPAGRIEEQPQHHVPLHPLVEQPRRILDRRLGVERHGRLLLRWGGRLARVLLSGWGLPAAGESGEDEKQRRSAQARAHRGPSSPVPRPSFPRCRFHAARRLSASSGESESTSRPRNSASSGCAVGENSPSCCASGRPGAGSSAMWWPASSRRSTSIARATTGAGSPASRPTWIP